MAEEASSSSPEKARQRRNPREFAFDRLGRRAHSEGELRQKMKRAGYSRAEIAETIAYLHSQRYLDDAAFARDFARAHAERRRWGPARIEKHLRALALSESHIEKALSETFPDGEAEAAERALSRFMETERRSASPVKRKARAYRHLLSRGFSPETAHELVTRLDFGDTEVEIETS